MIGLQECREEGEVKDSRYREVREIGKEKRERESIGFPKFRLLVNKQMILF
jgi:hypothetical protein